VIQLAPPAERGEHWWPVALAIHCRRRPACGAASSLPGPASLGGPGRTARAAGPWLIVGDPGRIDRQKTWLRIVTGVVIAFLTLANLLAAARLVVDILTNNKLFAAHPGGLLAAGGVVWATNVIAFGLWYWDLDRGWCRIPGTPSGPEPGVRLPEMQHSAYVPANWVPRFVDYLSLAFWTATAISPTEHISDQSRGPSCS